ncbi:hypothetical protein E4P40_13235 [Blastococcus sp. CT_GayMR20]|uniref:AAA family ATPase n=1 Tax=Blastococcus sp. CT_GayMR20 TaxID=2559609 RepID=UPI0010731713|nr:AAA family ATPase [Blastococcus sp. CT_GayMR20]TFV86196.1 hypothetical protein E4P40_13040 [Blastococcus sp. CT_GayMR20]TFV86231.1 hypothetical protein E4P40_13235 [Blastococcus sp. CT_GayMR20]
MSDESRPTSGEAASDIGGPGSSDTKVTALDRLVAALADHGREVADYPEPRRHGEVYLAQCPAHDDGNPSLVVYDHGSHIGLSCRTGCDRPEIVKAVGLKMSDLFSADYRYEDGRVVHREYDAHGKKKFPQSGNRQGGGVLYRLSEVVEAVAAGTEVHLCEGEKDADTLASLGLVATTAPGGAGGLARVDVTPLKGARVIAHPDRDAAGEKWTVTAMECLGDGHAASLKFLGPKVGKDVTDHIEAGYGLDEFVPLIPARHPRTQAVLDAALDASELDGLPEPTPLLTGALNASEYVLLSGKFATYKSFVALAWAFAVATGKAWSDHYTVPVTRPVVYVAAEGVSGIRKRLRALERLHGVTPAPGMFTVIRRPVRLAIPEEVEALRLVVADKRPALVVLDTWHRMTPGIEENSATETAVPLDVALQLRDDFATTVLVVHHTGHKQQHARGSSALEDDADASWMVRLGDSEDAEDRGPQTPRTLVHRKSKDGETAQPARLVLTVDDDGEATVAVDPFAAPVQQGRRGRPSKAGQREAQVAELVAALDDAGVGTDTGYRQVWEWAAEREMIVTEAVAREAVKRRRERQNGTTAAGAVTAVPLKGQGTALPGTLR